MLICARTFTESSLRTVIPISSNQDSVGPMTRTVMDAAIILSIIAGRDGKDKYTQTAPATIPDYTKFLDIDAIRGKRFGVPRAVFTDDAVTWNHPYINVAFNKSLQTIRSLGGIVVDPADLPSASDIVQSKSQGFVLNVDFKVCSPLLVVSKSWSDTIPKRTQDRNQRIP